jgi:signal peptidase I
MFTHSRGGKPNFGRYQVPPGEYLLVGDNRDNSFDSRFWGTVKEDQIVGRSTHVVASFDPNGWFSARWSRFWKGLP